MSIAWTADGTQLGSGGGNGAGTFHIVLFHVLIFTWISLAVVLGSLVDRQLEWHSIEVRLTDSKEIRVTVYFFSRHAYSLFFTAKRRML